MKMGIFFNILQIFIAYGIPDNNPNFENLENGTPCKFLHLWNHEIILHIF